MGRFSTLHRLKQTVLIDYHTEMMLNAMLTYLELSKTFMQQGNVEEYIVWTATELFARGKMHSCSILSQI